MNITLQPSAAPAHKISYDSRTVALARILQAAAQGSAPRYPSHIYLAQAYVLRRVPALTERLKEYLA